MYNEISVKVGDRVYHNHHGVAYVVEVLDSRLQIALEDGRKIDCSKHTVHHFPEEQVIYQRAAEIRERNHPGLMDGSLD